MRKIRVPDAIDSLQADAVIVGGGIVGTATAFWLSQAGLKVVLVEMRDGLATLDTAASAECFRAQYTEPALAALAQESIGMFETFSDVVGIADASISIHQPGYLFMTDDAAMVGDLKTAVDTQHEVGVTDTQFLAGDEVRARFPYVSSSVRAATFRQRDGWFSTHEATYGLAKGCGATFFVGTRATRILTDSQGVCGLQTTRGTIRTRTVVNAAGAFAAEVGRMAGIDLPLEIVRRQKVFVSSAQIPAQAPFTVDLVNDTYWRPETGGAILGWENPDEPAGPPSEHPPTDDFFAAQVLNKAGRLCPFWEDVVQGLKRRDVLVSAGHQVYTPDDQPLIGAVDELSGFFLNCGYYNGVMLAPAAGRLTADLIVGRLGSADNPLPLNRFEKGVVQKATTFMRGRR